MAKVTPSLIEQTSTIGDRVYYTRFGKQFSRGKAKSFTDKPISFHLYGIDRVLNSFDGYRPFRFSSSFNSRSVMFSWSDLSYICKRVTSASVAL